MKSIACSASAVVAIAVCLGVTIANASGPIAVYALVDKVAFEPSADKPERIRISGVFITAEERLRRILGAAAGVPLFRVAERQ